LKLWVQTNEKNPSLIIKHGLSLRFTVAAFLHKGPCCFYELNPPSLCKWIWETFRFCKLTPAFFASFFILSAGWKASVTHDCTRRGDAAAAMATFDAAVSGPDAAPDLRLAAHQYNQLLHLLASADHAVFPVHPAAAARRVFAHMLQARAPTFEATITSLARVVAVLRARLHHAGEVWPGAAPPVLQPHA
jgi:hypothetical protein